MSKVEIEQLVIKNGVTTLGVTIENTLYELKGQVGKTPTVCKDKLKEHLASMDKKLEDINEMYEYYEILLTHNATIKLGTQILVVPPTIAK